MIDIDIRFGIDGITETRQLRHFAQFGRTENIVVLLATRPNGLSQVHIENVFLLVEFVRTQQLTETNRIVRFNRRGLQRERRKESHLHSLSLSVQRQTLPLEDFFSKSFTSWALIANISANAPRHSSPKMRKVTGSRSLSNRMHMIIRS